MLPHAAGPARHRRTRRARRAGVDAGRGPRHRGGGAARPPARSAWPTTTTTARTGGSAAASPREPGPWQLQLDGIATLADVWVNGDHVARTENMFLRSLRRARPARATTTSSSSAARRCRRPWPCAAPGRGGRRPRSRTRRCGGSAPTSWAGSRGGPAPRAPSGRGGPSRSPEPTARSSASSTPSSTPPATAATAAASTPSIRFAELPGLGRGRGTRRRARLPGPRGAPSRWTPGRRA